MDGKGNEEVPFRLYVSSREGSSYSLSIIPADEVVRVLLTTDSSRCIQKGNESGRENDI